jgi:hypothetical protein
MTKCPECGEELDEEEDISEVGEEFEGDSAGTWTCSKCNTMIKERDIFCYNCGEPKEQIEEPVSQAALGKIVDVTMGEKKGQMKNIVPQPVEKSSFDFSIPTVESSKQSVYDASIFASQFPEWELLPPAMPIRRIKRSV